MKPLTENHEPMKGWVRVSLIIIPFIFIVGIFQGIGSLLVGLNPTELFVPENQFQDMVISLFGLLGTYIVISIFRHNIDKESFRCMGLFPVNIYRESLIGFILGLLIMMCGFVLLMFLQEIQWVGTTLNPANLISGLFMFLTVAVSEELFFRGYILNNLMKSFPKFPALLTTSILFSIFHIANSHYSWFSFLNLLLAGLLLGLPYIYTKSLWLPIALHFSWNFFQGTIFGFNVSGHDIYSLFTQSRTADTIWNGGGFGFEGSVLCVGFQLIAIGGLWWYYSRKEKINEINQSASPPREILIQQS